MWPDEGQQENNEMVFKTQRQIRALDVEYRFRCYNKYWLQLNLVEWQHGLAKADSPAWYSHVANWGALTEKPNHSGVCWRQVLVFNINETHLC